MSAIMEQQTPTTGSSDSEAVPPGYKRTELGVIPEDWEIYELDSLGSGSIPAIKAGPFGSSLTKATYVQDGYKVYGQEQVIRGDHLYGDYFITHQKYAELEACAVRAGDVLLSLVGTAGRLLVVPEGAPPGVINPRLIRFSFDKARVIPRFFRYLFESEQVQRRVARQAQGGTMGVLNAANLRSFQINLPPLREQRAIAETLSDVDGLLSALEAQIAKKRAIKQATMQQLLTGKTRLPGFSGDWEVKRLGEIATIAMGSTPSRQNPALWGSGHVWLSIADLKGKVVDRSSEQITDLAAASMRRVAKGTLLMSFKLSIGRLCFAGCDLFTNEAICSFTDLHANPEYLYYALERTDFSLYGKQAVKGYTLNSESLSAVEVILPEPAEQTAIATVLSDMDAEISSLESRRAKTSAIKQGMMQQLLTGRSRLVKSEVAA